MKRIELHGNRLVEVTRIRNSTLIIPLTWDSAIEYLEWCITNFDRLPFRYSSDEVRENCKKALIQTRMKP